MLRGKKFYVDGMCHLAAGVVWLKKRALNGNVSKMGLI